MHALENLSVIFSNSNYAVCVCVSNHALCECVFARVSVSLMAMHDGIRPRTVCVCCDACVCMLVCVCNSYPLRLRAEQSLTLIRNWGVC